MKKFIIVIGSLLIAVPIGLYIAGNLYSTAERVYEEAWGIDLPEKTEKIYEFETEQSFHGDGVKYNVYSLKDE